MDDLNEMNKCSYQPTIYSYHSNLLVTRDDLCDNDVKDKCYHCSSKMCDTHGCMCNKCDMFICNTCLGRKHDDEMVCQKIRMNNILEMNNEILNEMRELMRALVYAPNSTMFHEAQKSFKRSSSQQKNE